MPRTITLSELCSEAADHVAKARLSLSDETGDADRALRHLDEAILCLRRLLAHGRAAAARQRARAASLGLRAFRRQKAGSACDSLPPSLSGAMARAKPVCIVDLDGDPAERRLAERRRKALARDLGQEALQRFLLVHAEHRIVIAAHSGIADIGGALAAESARPPSAHGYACRSRALARPSTK